MKQDFPPKADPPRCDSVKAGKEADLHEAQLEGQDLTGADLTGADLTGAKLTGANLFRANLSNARLWHADLKETNLSEANLSGADFLGANLYKSKLWHADLTGTKSLAKHSFSDRKHRYLPKAMVDERSSFAAKEAYRGLKRLFITTGQYEDASWASYKEKEMERCWLFQNRHPAYLLSLFMGVLCGYGEKPHRVIISSLAMVLLYAVIYTLTVAVNSLGRSLLDFGEYFYFSIVTFTTLGYGDFVPKASLLARMLAGSEAFLGAFMMGLFVFTLARKYSAR